MILALPLLAGLAFAATEAPPAPERNPARAEEPAVAKDPEPEKAKDEEKLGEKEPPTPVEAPSVPWTDSEVAAAKAACTQLLADATMEYEPLPPIKEGMCGTPAPILLKSIGSEPKVEIDPPATVNCAVAAAVAVWLKDVVQPEASHFFGAKVVKLHNATSYACRNRYGGAKTPLSEHALANALDISEFVLGSGESVTVLDSWPRVVETTEPPLPLRNPARPETTAALAAPPALPPVSSVKRIGASVLEVAKAKAAEPPKRPAEAVPLPLEPIAVRKSDFVRNLHEAACKTFGTVLGPEANAAHKNHFHLDMKARRSGFCE